METTPLHFSRPLLGALALAAVLLAGCGPKVDRMKEGLRKSGMSAAQAECYAQQLSKSAETGPYNYMAELLNAGVNEKEAANKARRKYGAEFKEAVDTARKACAQ